jgi:hypothetical protein
MNQEIFGSVGSLVTAGLATAGLYLQSQLLDLLEGGLLSALGVLLFVIAAISSLSAFVFGFRVRSSLMMLLGVIMSIAVVFPRIEATGVEWRFGRTSHDQEAVTKTLAGTYRFTESSDAPHARVSWLFARWDQLSSNITQQLISILQVVDLSPDMNFLSRTQKFSQVFNLGIVDSELQQFIHQIFFNRCASWINLELSKGRSDGLLSAGEIARRAETLDNQIVISSGDTLWHRISELNSRGYFAEPPGPIQEFYTCQDLWQLSIDALKVQAHKSVAMIAAEEVPDGLSVDELFLALAGKFGEDGPSSSENIHLMLNHLSARMLYSALQSRSRGFARADLLDTRPVNRNTLQQRDEQDITQELRDTAAEEADAEQGTFFGLMMSLPYVQGILFAVLTMTYPLFALLMVVPSRAHQFLIWMSLWFWVKLWDFGFAVVMAIDELIWGLLPNPAVISDRDLESAASTFQVLMSADSSYNIAIYWDLMGMLLAAIPVVTGVVVYKAGRNVAGIIGSASNQYGRLMRESFMKQSQAARIEVDAPGKNAPTTLQRPYDQLSVTLIEERGPSVLAGERLLPGGETAVGRLPRPWAPLTGLEEEEQRP